MRKQTKVGAVTSAAALLAIGGAMTSFAAQGWVEEDGTWYYYDKDGNKVEDEWKKSGDNWFWLDSEEGGAMATDKLIDDDSNTYYVDGNGVMVTNTWVKVVNEDQDDDDPAEYRYYYMQSSGKAYKASENTGSTKFKVIDGKKYAFDEDGKMLYGWVNKDDATLAMDDSDWETATYYMGSWEDGSLKTGWQKITVYDEEKDDDYDYWFNFKSNGEKRKHGENDKGDILEKKINGKYYGFDNRGVMTYEWTIATGNGDGSTASNWRYFNSPEDGARSTKGWFKVVAPDEDGDDNTFKEYDKGETFAYGDAKDENERWYYADGDGELYVGKIKKIKGKYYGFAPAGNKAGSMLTGLCALTVNEKGEITKLWARDMDSDDLDDALKAEGDFSENADSNIRDFGSDPQDTLYYFGNDEDSDGALKTGNTTVNLDGDSYSFQFSKTGGAEGKGRGVNGIDDGKYIYQFGMKLKASSDDKYIVVYADGDTGATGTVNVHKVDTSVLRSTFASEADGQNKDEDTVSYVGTLGEVNYKTNADGSIATDDDGNLIVKNISSNYYLLNTSGSIVKNKTAAKDGNDWYYYVDEKVIKMYTNNKTLSVDSDQDALVDEAGNSLKDAWDNTKVYIEAERNVPADVTENSNLYDDGI